MAGYIIQWKVTDPFKSTKLKKKNFLNFWVIPIILICISFLQLS